MSLFNRTVRLTVLKEGRTKNTTFTIDGLAIDFQVTRTLKPEPNTLDVQIYNLKESTRKELESPEPTTITLEAGYDDNVSTLFHGDLDRIVHMRESADIITKLECGDGSRGRRNWIRKHWAKGTALTVVLNDLVKAAGLGKGNINTALSIKETGAIPDKLTHGLTCRGYAVDELNEICAGRGIEYSIQNKEVQLLKAGKGLTSRPVINLSPDSGLIGIPSVDNKGYLEATSLILPGIVPGALVNVRSEFIEGTFRVLRADYSGSNYGPSMEVSIEGKKVS